MGAGMSEKAKYAKIYRILKREQRKLSVLGIETEYRNQELRGRNFVVYMATIGPASNGESFGWLVLRFNPDKQPEAVYRSAGDIDYTDFHTRTIPKHADGGFEAGVKRVLAELAVLTA